MDTTNDVAWWRWPLVVCKDLWSMSFGSQRGIKILNQLAKHIISCSKKKKQYIFLFIVVAAVNQQWTKQSTEFTERPCRIFFCWFLAVTPINPLIFSTNNHRHNYHGQESRTPSPSFIPTTSAHRLHPTMPQPQQSPHAPFVTATALCGGPTIKSTAAAITSLEVSLASNHHEQSTWWYCRFLSLSYIIW